MSGALERRTVWAGPTLRVELERARLPNGEAVELEVVRHPGAAAVLPCDGDSAIIGPNGEYLAGPVLNEEVILTAKANTGTVMFQKMIADHAGHYSRPDIFQFRVNRRPKPSGPFEEREREVRAIRTAISDGEVRTPTDLLGALDDLNIDLEAVRGSGL